MLFKTKFGNACQMILNRYGASEAAVVALEILIQTAQADVKQKGPEELAQSTCRGLHMDKPGRGVVCAKCFDAALAGHTDKAISGDERAAGRREPPKDLVGLPERQAEIDRNAIAADVARMVAETSGRRE